MPNHPQYKVGKLTFISKKNMSRFEWVGFRKFGIGGSDVSSILDLNPYASITQLFYEKIGYRAPEDLNDNEAVFWGHMLEDDTREAAKYFDVQSSDRKNYLLNYYHGHLKRNIIEVDYIIKTSDYPWFLINLDGVEVPMGYTKEDFDKDIQAGVMPPIIDVHETKSISGLTSDTWESGIPVGYIAQAGTYMIPFKESVPDISGHIWSLEDGRELNHFPIPWSDGFTSTIIKKSKEFWELVKEGKKIMAAGGRASEVEHELSNIAPRPENITPAYDEFLNKLLIDRQKNTMAGPVDLLDVAMHFDVINAIKKYADGLAVMKGATIKEFLDKNNVRVLDFGNDGKVTWSRRFYMTGIYTDDQKAKVLEEIEGILVNNKLIK